MSDRKKVLVLFSFKNHKNGYIEKLFANLQAASKGTDLELHRGSLSDMRIYIKDGRMEISESLTGLNIADFDLVYFELWYKAPEIALAVALHATRRSVPVLTHEVLSIVPVTKIGELAKLADQNVPIPDTFISSRQQIIEAFKSNPPFNFPVVVKAAGGFGGRDNFLIHSFDELQTTLEENKSLRFVIQNFIPNTCDYRCLVMGGEIKLVIRRTRDPKAGTHLNNTSQGGVGELIDVASVPEEARRDVVRAAEILGRQEFAGVDLLFDSETGRHFILEVNQMPEIEIGAAPEQKMAALLGYMSELTANRTRGEQ